MLRVALCDDEAASRDALRILLEKILMEGSEEVVYEFSSGANAVSWLRKHPGEIDLLFLDVEMEGQSGMESAERIREFDTDLMIVFVTGHADYVFDGYRTGALDYLMKPVKTQKLMELLHRVREKMRQEENDIFIVRNTDGLWRFRLHDILYFYSDRRKVILVTKKGEHSFYDKLENVEKRLTERFIRIHQRFLINPEYVDCLNADSVLLNGQELPCSRKYREQTTARIARSLIGSNTLQK
ncbi:MAG: LytTR family DNA-binding domain-containing protein [Lachnospiraceae bacterium]|nr:LytTR family DNA-binding domain-containing protein [Lachnospiraceae bacterium]